MFKKSFALPELALTQNLFYIYFFIPMDCALEQCLVVIWLCLTIEGKHKLNYSFEFLLLLADGGKLIVPFCVHDLLLLVISEACHYCRRSSKRLFSFESEYLVIKF